MSHSLLIFLIFLVTTLANVTNAIPLSGITDIEGKPVTEAQLEHDKNKELVLFWATWCPTCKEKLTKILPLELGPKHPDTYILTINTDTDIGRVKSYIKKNNITLPIFQDPTRKTLLDPLKVNTAPHWAIYVREGKGKAWKLVEAKEGFDLNYVDEQLSKVHPQ